MRKPIPFFLPITFFFAMPDCRAELVAHYKFDESAAATTAANEVAFGTAGTVGAAVVTGVTGISGNAYSFAGATATQADIVDMEYASFLLALNASGRLTFSVWVQTTDTTGNRNCVIFAGDNTQNFVYSDLGVAAGQAGFAGAASARNRPVGAVAPQDTGIFSSPAVAPVNDGQWHHLVMTVDLEASRLDLWVDGVLANTQTMAIGEFPILNNFEIGRLGRLAPVDPYSGLVDDVQVYDEVLSGSQINYLKNNPGKTYAPADADSDGLDDLWEITYFGNITSQTGNGVGPDQDGATNLQEQAAGTNPTLADTDGDGRTDGTEINGPVFSNPLMMDTDNDGLSDGVEVNTHGTNPNEPDTDGDTLPDAWEISVLLDPTSAFGDNGEAGDPDNDGLNNSGEYSDGFQSSDPKNPDTDGDGYTDLQEDRFGAWGGINQTGTNPTNPDTDGDGIPDGQENPDVTYVPGVTYGTDPNFPDTDFDGFPDNVEFLAGSDPTDAVSTPSPPRGLVAHYKFDEATGATTAANALGNSPGAVGPSVITGVTGVAGNAYQFANLATQEGIVDMANATFLPLITGSKAVTYTAWIKSTDTSSGRNTVISAADSTLANSYVDMGIAGGGAITGALSGRVRPNGQANITEIYSNNAPSTTLVNTDSWHHVAITVDLVARTMRMFVDGVQVAENTAMTATTLPAFNNFEIGRLGRNAPTDAFEGLIDDVQVYNEALTPSRIAALFAMPGVSADEDHDGLDDQWEIDNFGSITSQDGSGDPDGDGISNENEETAGTDPGGEASTEVTVKITSVNFVPGGDYVINFTGEPNTTYRVTKSTTLENFVEMVPPLTVTTNANGIGIATVPANQAAGQKGFFRLETP